MTAGGLVNRESDSQPTEMGKAAVAQAWGEGEGEARLGAWSVTSS